MNGRVARILHLALIAGVATTFLVLALIRDLSDMPSTVLPVALVRAGALVLAGAAVAVHRVLRSMLPGVRAGEAQNTWWIANGGRVIVIWAAADGLAMVGAVFWFLTGDGVTLAVAGGTGLLLMALASPGKLAGG